MFREVISSELFASGEVIEGWRALSILIGIGEETQRYGLYAPDDRELVRGGVWKYVTRQNPSLRDGRSVCASDGKTCWILAGPTIPAHEMVEFWRKSDRLQRWKATYAFVAIPDAVK